MSVAYEPRSFLNEGSYPSLSDEHDPHGVDQRFSENDVAEQLSHYTNEAAMLPDDRVMGDERDLLNSDAADLADASRLDLDDAAFGSPVQVSLPTPSLPEHHHFESNEPSPEGPSSPSGRMRSVPKPNREIAKQADGKFHCSLDDCKEDVRAFSRKCEWNKHMDKHERPYRCPAEGCENLPGFTYSGGLLRHEREVHGKHGGPKKTVNCPHVNCKRHTGKGFSRQENLNEHLRRVHTGNGPDAALTPPEPGSPLDGNESDGRAGVKRKRSMSSSVADRTMEDLAELRNQMAQLKQENQRLQTELKVQTQNNMNMMAQIANLQNALGHNMHHDLGAPTAQMI